MSQLSSTEVENFPTPYSSLTISYFSLLFSSAAFPFLSASRYNLKDVSRYFIHQIDRLNLSRLHTYFAAYVKPDVISVLYQRLLITVDFALPSHSNSSESIETVKKMLEEVSFSYDDLVFNREWIVEASLTDTYLGSVSRHFQGLIFYLFCGWRTFVFPFRCSS
jgi:hypothetical protein